MPEFNRTSVEFLPSATEVELELTSGHDVLDKLRSLNKMDRKPNDNINGMAPGEWFNEIKTQIDKMPLGEIQRSLKIITEEIKKADALGQKGLVENLTFSYTSHLNELKAYKGGFTTSLALEPVMDSIKKIEPKGSVRVIDFANYQRRVPDQQAEIIKKAIDLNIFSDIIIIFTDLNGHVGKSLSVAEKEFINKNRDPIVLGIWKIKDSAVFHRRAVYITDWEDEHCHLTMPALIAHMAEHNVEIDIRTEEPNIDELLASLGEKHSDAEDAVIVTDKKAVTSERAPVLKTPAPTPEPKMRTVEEGYYKSNDAEDKKRKGFLRRVRDFFKNKE